MNSAQAATAAKPKQLIVPPKKKKETEKANVGGGSDQNPNPNPNPKPNSGSTTMVQQKQESKFNVNGPTAASTTNRETVEAQNQNSKARGARGKNRKKKPLVGQLPAAISTSRDIDDDQGDRGENGNRKVEAKVAAVVEPKKITLLKRNVSQSEAVVVVVDEPKISPPVVVNKSTSENVASQNVASTSKKPGDDTKTTSLVRKNSEPSTAAVKPKKYDETKSKSAPFRKSGADGKTADGSKEVRETVNEEALPELAAEMIYPLKNKNPRWPLAIYFCRLCDQHMNTLKYAQSHVKTPSHIKAKEDYFLDENLESIPSPPSESHCAALDVVLKRTVEEIGRSPSDVQQCYHLAEGLTTYFQERMHPGCMVRLYGSSRTGFALKTGNVNLELIYPSEFNHAWALMRACTLLTNDSHVFVHVEADFEAKWPNIKFHVNGFLGTVVGGTAVDCVLSVCNTQAFEIALLMETYAKYFPHLKSLAQICRYWAKTCHLDDAKLCGLPPYAFDLMLVHYLQQRQPIALPVFHEFDALKKGPGFDINAFYGFCNGEIGNYIAACASLLKADEWNLAELWLGFLKFYTLDFDSQTFVVNIRSSKPVTREEKDWNRRRLGIEDPFMLNKNVAQMTQNIYDFIMHCFRMTYKYFGVPQTIAGPLFEINQCQRLVLRGILPFLKQRRQNSNDAGGFAPLESAAELQKMLSDLLFKLKTNDVVVEEKEKTSASKPVSHRYERSEMLQMHSDNYEWESKWNSIFNESESNHQRMNKAESSMGLKHAKMLVRKTTSQSDDECGRLNASNGSSGSGNDEPSAITYVPSSSSGKATPLPSVDGFEVLDRQSASILDDDRRQSSVDEESKCLAIVGCVVDRRSTMLSECSEISSPDDEDPPGRLIDFMAANRSDCITEADEEGENRLSEDRNGVEISASADCLIRGSDSIGNEGLPIFNGVADDVSVNGVNNSRVQGPELPRLDVIKRKRRSSPPNPEFAEAIKELAFDDYVFVFAEANFTDGKIPTVLCTFCNYLGHHSSVCPEKQLPPLCQLPPMLYSYKQTLDSFLFDAAACYALTPHRIQWQEVFRTELEQRLKITLRPDAQLSLFGSSCNGFGFVRSDLDLCLTFGNGTSLHPDENPLKIIKLVANALRKDKDFRDVLPVTKAKVPIVRFFHYPSKLEGDISLYNCLALRNTELLRTYSSIDPRVRSLGYLVKVFAKQCDIGDASRGSLSSYAYVLMMLHYLQRTTPPVIPVLQELYDPHKGPRPSMIVDGWETYFYSNLLTLRFVWKDYGKNKQTIHDLWLGFLRYYTEAFDPKNLVIQMRRTEPMSKFEKLWGDKPLAIEDPFDLNHNLASGLSWRMYIYIMKVFIQAREVFGHPRHEKMVVKAYGKYLTYEGLEDYFFNHALRQKEPPPKDRVCKLCGHVGHFVENCPRKRSNQKKAAAAEEAEIDGDEDVGSPKKGNVAAATSNLAAAAAACS